MVKFYTKKSNAKKAAVNAGIKVIECNLVEKDGQFAYIEQQVISTEPPNKYMMMLGYSIPIVKSSQTSMIVKDGRRVIPKHERRKADRSKSDRRHSSRIVRSGYTIEKEREKSNGVTRPSVGTVCGAVWSEFDTIHEVEGVVLASQLALLADSNGWNRTNVSCEFYNWRKFKGIKGRSIKKEGV